MNTGHALPLRPEPASWKRGFMRFGRVGLASRPKAGAGRNKAAIDQRTLMNNEPRSSPSRAGEQMPDGNMRAARDAKPRLGRPIQLQLSGRLKAIFGTDLSSTPDAMRNLAMRIEAHLRSRK
jgi:hypothetical protein